MRNARRNTEVRTVVSPVLAHTGTGGTPRGPCSFRHGNGERDGRELGIRHFILGFGSHVHHNRLARFRQREKQRFLGDGSIFHV